VSSYVGPFNDPDRYTLVKLTSRGGEGEVWLATIVVDDVAVDVAVKIMHQQSIPDIALWQARWQRQAELLRSLDHSGLVKIREVFDGPLPHPLGAPDPTSRTLFLVMNWASGINLQDWVKTRPHRRFDESIGVLANIADALDYLHGGPVGGHQVVHRDIKPANVMIDGDRARLVDFGFARLQAGTVHTFAGTPSYIAPEVIGGGIHDDAADNFGFGATAYYAATGQPPTMNDYGAMLARLRSLPGIDHRPGVPERFLAMLHPDPAKRPVSAVGWITSLVGRDMAGAAVFGPRPGGAVAAPSMSRDRPPPAPPPAGLPAEPIADAAPTRSRALVVGIVVCTAIVLIGGAAFAMSRSGDSRRVATQTATSVPASSTTTTTIPGPAIVPNVVGVDVSVARKLLTDAGVKNIVTIDRQDARPAGLVLAQDPSAGTPVPGLVTLTVSRSAASPTTTTPRSSSTTISPVSTLPPPPSQLYLFDARYVSGFADPRSVTLGGRRYGRSVEESFYDGRHDSSVEYGLDRSYARFRADVGIRDDNSDSSARATFELWAVGDGPDKMLWTSKDDNSDGVGLGTPVTADVNVKGVLRIRLVVRSESGDGSADWGDANVDQG